MNQPQLAPRAVYTTGKGASAVGLTAGACVFMPEDID